MITRPGVDKTVGVATVRGMVRRAWLAAAIAGALVVVAPANAGQPPVRLLKAEVQTARASSVRVAMTTSVRVAGKSVKLSAGGVERLEAHQASMVFAMPTPSPAIGTMQMLTIGSRSYIHYRLLDQLHAARPQIKPWIVTDAASTAGFDPWALGRLRHSMSAASDYRLLGTSGGTSRYGARIDLHEAIASNPQLKQLLARAGGVAASLLDRPVSVVFDVGGDGYLHRVREQVTTAVGGHAVAITTDVRMRDFNIDPGPIVAPPADQVMTLAQFKKLAGQTTPSA